MTNRKICIFSPQNTAWVYRMWVSLVYSLPNQQIALCWLCKKNAKYSKKKTILDYFGEYSSKKLKGKEYNNQIFFELHCCCTLQLLDINNQYYKALRPFVWDGTHNAEASSKVLHKRGYTECVCNEIVKGSLVSISAHIHSSTVISRWYSTLLKDQEKYAVIIWKTRRNM